MSVEAWGLFFTAVIAIGGIVGSAWWCWLWFLELRRVGLLGKMLVCAMIAFWMGFGVVFCLPFIGLIVGSPTQ